MRILQVRATRGWTLDKTAVFLVDEQTLLDLEWMRRLDEPGDRPLVQTVEPVNRYPDFVRGLVRQLKALCPAMAASASPTCWLGPACASRSQRSAASSASRPGRHRRRRSPLRS
jgi:hypothetical protein